MHIALTGPCAPSDLQDLLDPEQRARADSFPGYRGIAVSSLAGELVRRGHLVSVVTASYEGVSRPETFQGDSLTIHVIAGRQRARERARDLWSRERKAMKELLQEIRPDVVSAHWTYEFALAALESGLPTLVTAHDAPVTILRHFHDPYRTARLALAAWVRARRPPLTAVSPYLAQRWRREMGWRRDIAVIPNMSPFGPREGGRCHQQGQRVVTVADSSGRKNVRSALEAWPTVLRAFPSAELHLVGPGLGPSQDLALWAEQHSLQRQVCWHGAVDRAEVENLIESATALLHPSLEESLGMTLMEAMALGVPVVGGNTSGAVSWTMGGCGALTDVRSPRAIAATLTDLLGDPEWCLRNGEAGKRRVADAFSPEVVASAYELEYEAVLSQLSCPKVEGRS
jgi:glycosyltransferase involved in cell wall biosynthesis